VSLGLSWERPPLELGGDAPGAELVNMLDTGESIHHLVLPQLLQRLEVQVAIALMPEPRPVVTPCHQIERSGDLHPQLLEAIPSTPHLDEEALVLVADAQNTVLDVDVAVAFVELPEAYDVGGESRDEVHPRDRSVLAGLPLQDHRPGTLDRYRGAVAESDDPADLGVEILESEAALGHAVRGPSV
jgi:hypothetical protein